MKRRQPVALHSHPSELVRSIRSAHRQYIDARAEARRCAKLLYAFRAAGVKPPKDSPLALKYANARSRMSNASHLLARAQARYKAKHGRKWVLRRRDLETGEAIGRVQSEGLFTTIWGTD